MRIKNASVLGGDFTFQPMEVEIAGERIAEVGPHSLARSGEDALDGEGCLLIPGFIDIHTHGAMGYDGCDGDWDGYEKMADFYARCGVTSHLFTTMTLAKDQLCEILRGLSGFIDSGRGASYSHGIYLEGPFINCCRKGAQAGEHIIPPSMAAFTEFQEAADGKIRVAVVAPEVEGAREFIQEASKTCAVSIAHTDADYQTAVEAMENGTTDVTHLFNAMPPFHHRNPGVIGAAFDTPSTFMEIICDGIHLHPSIIRSVFKVAADRVVLISDSMQAAGMPDGKYALGGQDVFVSGNKATLADGTIAGSVSNVHACVKNCVKFGVPLEQAVRAGSYNPAKLLGVDQETGSIEAGKLADMVLCTPDLEIRHVFVKGKQVL